MSENKLTEIEKQASYAWREWPIHVVIQLKRLYSIQDRMDVDKPIHQQLRESGIVAPVDFTETQAEQAAPIEDPSPPDSAPTRYGGIEVSDEESDDLFEF